MRLLILTQKVDMKDDVLGFFHRWIEEFSLNTEKVTVICLEKGEYKLPENVEVLSLGKEGGVSKLGYVANFYKYIWHKRAQYSHVIVHMNPEYVVLGGVVWRLLKKRIGLWYLHRQVTWKLKVAEFFVHHIFTASKQSFNLKSKKVSILGHGIDLDKFSLGGRNKSSVTNILHVSRISRIKNIDVLIKAVHLLKEKTGRIYKLSIIGAPAGEDGINYKEELESLIKDLNLTKEVTFLGSIPNSDIHKFYNQSDISVNLAPTGGVDKVVLESMASGLPVFVSNESFKSYLGEYDSIFRFNTKNSEDLAEKITNFLNNFTEKDNLSFYLRKKVEESSNLKTLIKRIVKILSS